MEAVEQDGERIVSASLKAGHDLVVAEALEFPITRTP
jgi:hypothetical protein